MLETNPLISLILAAAVSLLLTYFFYRKKSVTKMYIITGALRFVTIFTVLLLLLAPEISNKTVFTERPSLNLLLDNSSSIRKFGFDSVSQSIHDNIVNDDELREKFSINTFTFDEKLNTSDSVTFKGKQTNIAASLKGLKRIQKQSNSAVVLLSDGNQTFGEDYQYFTKEYQNPIYPIVLGDTTRFSDLKITQLNVNKYAYLKNKFPVEAFLSYEGDSEVTSDFRIIKGNQVVFSKKVSFNTENRSEVIQTELLADKTGVQQLKAEIVPLSEEKNKTNNTKLFAIEVIDEKNNIAIVTDVLHPDIGALKKIIESNEFRKASIIRVEEMNKIENDFQLYILYQPNVAFKRVLEEIKASNQNYWIIDGTDTNWSFLNTMDLGLQQTVSPSEEDFLPVLNPNFGPFQVENIDFSDFPPLLSSMGNASFLSSNEILLYKKIGAIETSEPLLATFGDNNQKAAILFGEGIWKWRSASYREMESTETFDNFFGKLIQYLASNKKRSRLTVENESFYYGNASITIKASYYDKNFVFDPNASLEIEVKNQDTNESVTFPMLFKGTFYQVDVSSLPAGNYDFTVRETSEKIAQAGSFTILEYDVEKQFVNPDIKRLTELANTTEGKVFYSKDFEILKEELLTNSRYLAVQKSKENIVPLIEWQWLLILLSITLAAEWFLRKYYGLI
ncbi:vWA domain-containing protein [Galbibacter mesophilus]|uniref:vWA domain-containing protein n=1 Tax=Galbibacter mesophilus TaxID=379069 RepID=UPI00191D2E8E|nr:vWA domain-containing protein [Galbibacter mesophilus]MCM5663208.1 VWA domain-containing protein [Galbibacter mesophilus]